jgi:prevent-host-death family protein
MVKACWKILTRPPGSFSATVGGVLTIPQKELRNNVAEVLRRAEAGEQIVVTVAGRPVAQLGPATRRRWVGGPALHAVWQTRPPKKLGEDLENFAAPLVDPFE